MADKIKQLLATILGLPADDINEQLTRANCERWDSVNHLRIISMLEKECGIDFSTNEVMAIEGYNDLSALIDAKSKS